MYAIFVNILTVNILLTINRFQNIVNMNISIMCSNNQIIYENNRSQLENCKNKFSDKTGTLYSILVKNGYVKKLLLLFFEI